MRTGANGADARGLLSDDEIWGAVYAVPYPIRDPELTFVVESDDGRVTGYVLGTDDTDAFESWFASEWWPRFSERWPRPDAVTSVETGVLTAAYRRGSAPEPLAADYPAHLHIDLLPELQGQGWGRRLIETFTQALRERGVRGVHLVAGADNAGAAAFYPRVGFTPLPSPEGARAFGMTL